MHTPPPWKDAEMYGAIIAPNTECLETEAYGGFLIGESIQKHNRPIIIAAPIMYNALKKILEICYSDKPNTARIAALASSALTEVQNNEKSVS